MAPLSSWQRSEALVFPHVDKEAERQIVYFGKKKKPLWEGVNNWKKQKTGEGQFQPTLQQRNRHQSALRPRQLHKTGTCIRLSAEPYVFMIWRPKLRKSTRMSTVSLSIVCTCCSTSKFRPSWAFVYCLLTFLPLARLSGLDVLPF